MPRKNLFKIQDTQARVLDPEDGILLQGLLEKCTDYFELVEGCPPAASAAQDLFIDKPPEKTVEDKFLTGLWEPVQKLIGVLDVVRNHPSPGEWFVGLLLIDPAYRRRGLGRRVYQAFEQWVISQRAEQIGLGVVAENRCALDFWHSLGINVTEERAPTRYENRDNIVIIMKCSLHKT
jgi:ribosomal protein S18 acetylase RimI-like enzyme